MSSDTPSQRALIVLGMHRSGTSAVTGVLQCLKVQLGRHLYHGHTGINDKGYFEHSDIADLNDEVLTALGSSWDDILPWPKDTWTNRVLDKYSKRLADLIRRDFVSADLWAVKDPRVCRLLPWWQRLLDQQNIDPRYLLVLRHPASVSRSLQRRDNFSLEKSLLLWIDHTLQAELYTRSSKRTVLLFESLLTDPMAEMGRIEAALGIGFPLSPYDAAPCINDFLSAGLRHHRDEDLSGHSVLEEIAGELFKTMSALATGDSTAKTTDKLDALYASFEQYRQQFPHYLVEHIRSINTRRSEYHLTWLRVSRSKSWIIGKPIRFVERFFGADV